MCVAIPLIVAAAFLTQKCQIDGRTVKLEIWDTAGQERFHSLAPMYYRNASAALVVYDVTKAASLERAKSWVKELQRQASPEIVIALAGNKVDLVEDGVEDDESLRQVPTEEAQGYATEAGLLFYETSAKTGYNVQEVFTAIAKAINPDTVGRRGGATVQGLDSNRVDLNANGATEQGGSCAC